MQRLKGFPALLFIVLGNANCFSVDPTSRRAAIAWVGTAIGCCAVERDRRHQAALQQGHQRNENRKRWWFWNADKDGKKCHDRSDHIDTAGTCAQSLNAHSPTCQIDDSRSDSDSESDSDSDGGDDGQETDSDSDDD